MGNKHATSLANSNDPSSLDPRGRSWSFHGLKAKKQRTGSSMRGRSSSLSDAGRKHRRGSNAGIAWVPAPNGRSRDGVVVGSMPARVEWGPGDTAEGVRSTPGGQESLKRGRRNTSTAEEGIPIPNGKSPDAFIVSSVRRDRLDLGPGITGGGSTLAGREMRQRGATMGSTTADRSLQGRRGPKDDCVNDRGNVEGEREGEEAFGSGRPTTTITAATTAGVTAVACRSPPYGATPEPPRCAFASPVVAHAQPASRLPPDPFALPLTQCVGNDTHHISSLLPSPTVTCADVVSSTEGHFSAITVGVGSKHGSCFPSGDVGRNTATCCVGPTETHTGLERDGRAEIDTEGKGNSLVVEQRWAAGEDTELSWDVLQKQGNTGGDSGRQGDWLSWDVAEKRGVAGDCAVRKEDSVLWGVAQRRGFACLNRELSLSHDSSSGSLVLSLSSDNLHNLPATSADPLRSPSLHSLELMEYTDRWGPPQAPPPPSLRLHQRRCSVQSNVDDVDTLEVQEFRPRSNSSTLAELNSRARVRIAMGTAGARLRRSYACPNKENYRVGSGGAFNYPRPPTVGAEEVSGVCEQRLSAMDRTTDSGEAIGSAEGPGKRWFGGVASPASPPPPPPPQHCVSSTLDRAGNVYGHVLAVPTFHPGLTVPSRHPRPLPDIHENAPLSSSLPAPHHFPSSSPAHHHQLHRPPACGLRAAEAQRHCSMTPPSVRRVIPVKAEVDEPGEDWEPVGRPRSFSLTSVSPSRLQGGGGGAPGVSSEPPEYSSSSLSSSPRVSHEFRQRSHSVTSVPANTSASSLFRMMFKGDKEFRHSPLSPLVAGGRALEDLDRAWSYSVTSLADQTMPFCDARKDFSGVRDRTGEGRPDSFLVRVCL